MKAIQIKSPGELEIIEMQKPKLTDENNVIIKIQAAGICGSDIGIYNGKMSIVKYPIIIGHELVGIVDEIGNNVKNLKLGQRVIINQVISCNNCYFCNNGYYNLCDSINVRGVYMNGGCSEYISVREKDCYVIPDSISSVDAVMIEPLTIAIQACNRAELNENDTLLILGFGALGRAVLKIAKLNCDNIIVADVVDDKLKLAKNEGAKYTVNILKKDFKNIISNYTNGYGPSVSIDSACTNDSLLNLLEITRKAGRIVTLGVSTNLVPINPFLITSKELNIKGSRIQNKKFEEAISLIKSNKINLDNYVSHIFPLSEAKKAFEFINSKDESIRKVVISFEK